MKKLVLVASAVVALANVTPVSAADLGIPVTAEPAAGVSLAAYDWSGFYAGVNGGYSWGEAQTEGVGDLELRGGLFGGQIGYNQDLGGVVLGAEADIQWSGLDGDLTTPLGTEVEGDLEYFGTVRARAGVALDRVMPYVTGGFAYGRVSGETSFAGGFSTEETVTGWTAGGGAELAITDAISVKAEYLYTDFGTETLFRGTIVEDDVGTSFSTIRAGVNFRF